MQMLERHAWPGNVRELRNCVERLLLLADSEINEETAALAIPLQTSAPPAVGTLSSRLEVLERDIILDELKRRRRNMTETARALGLERSHLYKKCQQLGIDLHSVG